MIFYFSGTGNSYQAALAVQNDSEELKDIAVCVNSGTYSFDIPRGESVGFALPVYYGGLPSIAAQFIKQLRLSGQPSYCYGVFTCAVAALGAGQQLFRLLEQRGIRTDAVFSVKMPMNYVLLFKSPEEDRKALILKRAEAALADIRGDVLSRRSAGLPASLPARAASAVMYPVYSKGRKTARFHTDRQCIGCGVCVGRCPAKAMVMEDGRPKWVSERCIHCMACIRCGAVQYGNRTKGKKRYVNPILKSCH